MEPQGAKQKGQEFMEPAYICFSRMGVVLQDVSVHALGTVTVSDCGLWLYNMCESAVGYSALHLECHILTTFLMSEFAEKTRILQNQVESSNQTQSLVVLMVGWFYFLT